ncbi:hypothetical protein [Maledivibacter halophilus]|uniref:Uncharacterized protein n=1 Tax=Maledivibacter halophilus TaxID=36842 RepID=A0A1T5M1P7_9FIRM|nr:hypothetical protein [Maledivibacter halophilus]SKC82187.1 hypothetical protein SAMN02194393_03720 [Maledivibacter halophilus]
MFKRKILFAVILLILMSIVAPLICYGNSAEPPSILIIVPNAPDNLEISIESDNEYKKAGKSNKANETYYTFYLRDLKNTKEYNLKISTGSNTFEILLDQPLKTYRNIFTLDLKNQRLIPGKSLSRSIVLLSSRVILTLIIEALIFFVFGYRQKRSWYIFLIINLLTQGVLNIWLNGFFPLDSYIILALIFGEIFVFIVESLAFLTFIKEHSRLRTILYVLLANILSLIAGGYIITIMPI